MYLLTWPLILMVARPPMLTETVKLRSFDVPVAGLHPSLHGLKIAHISDLHFNDNNSVEMGTSDDILEQAARAEVEALSEMAQRLHTMSNRPERAAACV